jgi:hypothetical protein
MLPHRDNAEEVVAVNQMLSPSIAAQVKEL